MSEKPGRIPGRPPGARRPEADLIEFSLSRQKLVFFLAGFGVLGVLVFIAGLLVGMNAMESVQAEFPSGPVEEVGQDLPAQETPEMASSPAPEESGEEAEAEAGAEPAQEPETAVSSSARAPFTVQVGAFRVQDNARQYAEELSGKGYLSHVFEGMDADGRPWYCVRVNYYDTREEAARAAVLFKEMENREAVVRPAGEL